LTGHDLKNVLSVFDEYSEQIDTMDRDMKCDFEPLSVDVPTSKQSADAQFTKVSVPEKVVEPMVTSSGNTGDKAKSISPDDIWKPVEKANGGKDKVQTTAGPTSVGTTIRHGGLWDDADVTAMKPVRVVSLVSCIDEYDHSEEGTALRLIALQLGGEAAQPINWAQLGSVAAIGTALFASSVWLALRPHAEVAQAESLRSLCLLWTASYAGNVYAVSIPGRLDRMYAEKVHLKPWQSMFEPASWAFAIWAVIYGLEALVTLSVLALQLTGGGSVALRTTLTRALPFWVTGNAAQSMWCFVFRPPFSGKLHVPTICLAVAAVAYCVAHWQTIRSLAAVGALTAWESWQLRLTRYALSIHCMWLIFSAVVTLNSWIVVSYAPRVRGLQTTAGFASAFLVSLAGMLLSMYSLDPMFAVVTAWAMRAASERSFHKATMVPTAGDKRATSVDVHESLAGVEALLSATGLCVAGGVLLVPVVSAVVARFA
jgi:hypothetical protein